MAPTARKRKASEDSAQSTKGRNDAKIPVQPKAQKVAANQTASKAKSPAPSAHPQHNPQAAPSKTPDLFNGRPELLNLGRSQLQDRQFKRLIRATAGRSGLNYDLPPMSSLNDIYFDLTKRALSLGLDATLASLKGRVLKVATVCSGTESPLLALREINTALSRMGQPAINFEHVYSAEIEPFKQAYIDLNFEPPLLFSDVSEMAEDAPARTAYGGENHVPEEVDILVAGVSCKTFSRLNNVRNKALDAAGESQKTFISLVKLLRRNRTPIIVLENVFNAPWEQLTAVLENDQTSEDQDVLHMLKDCWHPEDAGYATCAVGVDSKRYYVPQTRLRGYAVGFSRYHFQDAGQLAKAFGKLLDDLRRDASSPIEDFMFSSDDPRLQMIRSRLAEASELDDKLRHHVLWDKTYAASMHFREQAEIGFGRPLSCWVPSQGAKVPDYMWGEWMARRTDREWDFLDTCYLLGAKNGYDNFAGKSKVLDVSQSNDRVCDPTHLGLSGCITPCGLPLSTLRGGPITGIENLALQGLPIDKIIINKQTDRELQDLAGNAMTSTVVGAALLSALILSHSSLAKYLSESESLITNPNSHHAKLHIDKTTLKPITAPITYRMCDDTMSQLSTLATGCALYCPCETPAKRSAAPLLKCQHCGHTACKTCAGNSEHAYQPFFPDRMPHSTFAQAASLYLPRVLHLDGFVPKQISQLLMSCVGPLRTPALLKYVEAVHMAIQDTFYLAGTTTTTDARHNVKYHGPYSQLILTLANGDFVWTLFAVAEKEEPANSSVRTLLKKPVARMIGDTAGQDNLFKGTWELWLPHERPWLLTLEGRGDKGVSWGAANGITQSSIAAQQEWRALEIDHEEDPDYPDIRGRYESLPNCGMACRSLFRRTNGEKPAQFLFLEQQPHRLPQLDRFVFAKSKHRLTNGEIRDTVAELEASFRMPNLGNGRLAATCSTFGTWAHANFALVPIDKVETHEASVEGLSYLTDMPLWTDIACEAGATAVLSCRVPKALIEMSPYLLQDLKSQRRKYYSELPAQRYILRHLTCVLAFFRTQKSTFGAEISTDDMARCLDCSPKEPTIKWFRPTHTFGNVNGTVSGAGQEVAIVKPLEIRAEASAFECAMKKRPATLVIGLSMKNSDEYFLDIGINIAALAHRAWSLASRWHDTRLHFQLIKNCDNSDQMIEKSFILLSNNGDGEFAYALPGHAQLRPDQQRSLHWMITREQEHEAPFVQERVEDVLVPELQWRGKVTATGHDRHHGGVLADDVGYGKTALTLALIWHRLADGDTFAQQAQSGCLPIKATLIIVPRHLIEQWQNEVEFFLGSELETTVISTITQLHKTVKNIHAWDIIIVSRSIFEKNASYIRTLASETGVSERGAGGLRAFAAWLQEATTKVETLVDSQSNSHGTHGSASMPVNQNGSIYEELPCDYEHEIFDWKKASAKAAEKISKTSTSAQPQASTSQTAKQTLHRFKFFRIVEDEVTYKDAEDTILINSIKADSRWLLSGTLPVQTFSDVAEWSQMLGLDLGASDDDAALLKSSQLRAIRKDRTQAETFRAAVDMRGLAWHDDRHAYAQRFCSHFIRKNETDTSGIRLEEHHVVVQLQGLERILYTEAQRQLTNQGGYLIKATPRTKDGDRDYRLKDFSDDCASAPELLLRASLPLASQGSAYHSTDIRQLLEHREDVAQGFLRHEFKLLLNRAEFLNSHISSPDSPYTAWKTHLGNFLCGDAEITSDIKAIVTDRELNPQKFPGLLWYDISGKEDKSLGKDDMTDQDIEEILTKTPDGYSSHISKAGPDKLLKPLVGEIYQYCAKYRSQKQLIRYLANAEKLQTAVDNDGIINLFCSLCKGSSPVKVADFNLLNSCGHTFCGNCAGPSSNKCIKQCPVLGCDEAAAEHNWTKPDVDLVKTADIPVYGSKLKSIIGAIEATGKDEKVLVFVHWDDVMSLVEEALGHNGIPYKALNAENNHTWAGQLDAFKTEPVAKSKVLLSNSSNESVSGANLQRANHVMFVSPMHVKNQYTWDSQYKQAIGRCRRFGQKAEAVHVYHFLAQHTVDVDLQENWSGKKLVVCAGGGWAMKPRSELNEEEKGQSWRGGFLAEERA